MTARLAPALFFWSAFTEALGALAETRATPRLPTVFVQAIACEGPQQRQATLALRADFRFHDVTGRNSDGRVAAPLSSARPVAASERAGLVPFTSWKVTRAHGE